MGLYKLIQIFSHYFYSHVLSCESNKIPIEKTDVSEFISSNVYTFYSWEQQCFIWIINVNQGFAQRYSKTKIFIQW